jgi:hypothetical protein
MREYRYYNSVKWGSRYNRETEAHHVYAADYGDLRTPSRSLPHRAGNGYRRFQFTSVESPDRRKHDDDPV